MRRLTTLNGNTCKSQLSKLVNFHIYLVKNCVGNTTSDCMRGGKIVILVHLASDDSESSQRIGMLDNRLQKKKKIHGSKAQEEERW